LQELHKIAYCTRLLQRTMSKGFRAERPKVDIFAIC